MCILSVNELLKVVGYFDLSVLSISVMGFQKKKFRWGVGELYPISFGFLEFFNFAKPLILHASDSFVIADRYLCVRNARMMCRFNLA